MATFGDALALSVGLDARAYNKGAAEVRNSLRKTREAAQKEAQGVEEAMDKASESFARLTRNAAKLFAIFTAGRAVKDFVADITGADAALGRLAQRIGQAPSDISAMASAVQRSGGSFDGAAGSFQRFSDSIQELKATGNTSILPFLYRVQAAGGKTINLNKDIAQTYIDLADNLKQINDTQGSATANYYGRQLGLDEGTVALLVQGGDALRRYTAESRRLGIATKEDTDAAQAFQRSLRSVMQASESLGRSILTAVTPTVVDLLKRLQNWIELNREWIKTEITDRIKLFADYLKGIDWKAIEEGIKSFISGANDAAKAVGGWKTVAELFFGLWAASKMAAIFAPILGSIATVRLALMRLGPIGWALLGVGAVGAALAEADPNKAIVSGGRPGGGRNPGDDLPGLGHLGERDGGARNRTGLRARAARAKHVDGPLTQNYPAGLADGIRQSAKDLGVNPRDIATAISYETGGTFDSWKSGPHTKWGHHRGLIQWGEPQRAQYGVTKDMTPGDQMKAVTRYLRNSGVKPGMGLNEIYSAINAGKVGRMNRSDRPGFTVQRHVNEMRGPHGRNADRLLGSDASSASASSPSSAKPRPATPETSKAEAPKPSAWNGYPGASDAIASAHSAQAANVMNRTMNDNRTTTTSEANFNGGIHVHTAATTGDGIAAELQDSIRRKSFATAANYGQA